MTSFKKGKSLHMESMPVMKRVSLRDEEAGHVFAYPHGGIIHASNDKRQRRKYQPHDIPFRSVPSLCFVLRIWRCIGNRRVRDCCRFSNTTIPGLDWIRHHYTIVRYLASSTRAGLAWAQLIELEGGCLSLELRKCSRLRHVRNGFSVLTGYTGGKNRLGKNNLS